MSKPLPPQFRYKTVPFDFQGRQLRFILSQSLFSSTMVDDGSRLLLKYTAESVNLRQVTTMLDIGSGVGVLGICLQKAFPQMQVTAQDRDALALAFTQENAQLNQVTIGAGGGLALAGLNGRTYDLILANLPGKAGQPVLQALVRRIPTYLSANGVAGIVVVNPLAEAIGQTLAENGSEIVRKTRTNTYTIFLFRGGQPQPEPEDPLTDYWRTRTTFQAEKATYALDVAYNLTEFDTLGYETRLALKLLPATAVTGHTLYYNPGQGHLPVAAHKLGAQATAVTLASRDQLSLAVSQHNLAQNGHTAPVACQHIPTLAQVTGSYDWLIITPDFDAGVPWSKLLPELCADLLTPNGRMLLTGKSGFIGRLLAENKALRLRQNKKYHGLRAVLMEKK